MRALPKTLKKYFWDVDFENLDKDKYSYFIIERILELGDRKAAKWMKNNFSQEKIKKVIYNSRNLSLKSANFWRLIFNLDKNKILCLKKSFRNKQRAIWRY